MCDPVTQHSSFGFCLKEISFGTWIVLDQQRNLKKKKKKGGGGGGEEGGGEEEEEEEEEGV